MYRKSGWLMGLALVLLSACAETPYAPAHGNGGGYRDVQVGFDRFHIEIDGNSDTSAATMGRYFHRRARELCGSSQYAYFYNFDQPGATTSSDGDFSSHGPRVLSGEAVCH